MTDTVDLTAGELRQLDLLDPRTFVEYDLTALWRTLRREAPVFRHPRGFWVVTRYADVIDVYKDSTHFTSAYGNVLATLMAGGDSAAGRMLAVTDGPDHRRMRSAVVDSMRERTMRPLAERLRARTSQLVRRTTTGEPFDFAAEIAEHLPMGTICDLMDIPLGDRAELLGWNKQALSSDTLGATESDALQARGELLTYLTALVQERRERGGDDLVSDLIAYRPGDGTPLSDEEVVYNCYSLLIGGDESSRMSAICGVIAFCRYPDEWRRLRAGDVSVASAVEEVLRWTTPAMHVGRRATHAVDLGGQSIGAGDVVTLWNISANRDDEVFDRADDFVTGRHPNRHLAFGYGRHFCVGAQLGRLELGILLDTLRSSVSDLALAGEPRRVYSNFLFGYSTLPVSFSP